MRRRRAIPPSRPGWRWRYSWARRAPAGDGSRAKACAELARAAPEGQDAGAEPGPIFVAAEAAVRKAAADLALQRAMRIPDPTFLLQYEHQPPDAPNSGGLGMSLPLPLWNRNRGNIRAAEANLAQAESAGRAKCARRWPRDIHDGPQAYREAGRRLRRYESEVRPRAAQVLESVQYAYKKGGAALVDLLQAERNDNDVRLATAQAMADSATAALTLTLPVRSDCASSGSPRHPPPRISEFPSGRTLLKLSWSSACWRGERAAPGLPVLFLPGSPLSDSSMPPEAGGGAGVRKPGARSFVTLSEKAPRPQLAGGGRSRANWSAPVLVGQWTLGLG